MIERKKYIRIWRTSCCDGRSTAKGEQYPDQMEREGVKLQSKVRVYLWSKGTPLVHLTRDYGTWGSQINPSRFNHRPMIIILRTNLNDIRDKMQVSKNTEIKIKHPSKQEGCRITIRRNPPNCRSNPSSLKGGNAAERVCIVEVESYTMVMAPIKMKE